MEQIPHRMFQVTSGTGTPFDTRKAIRLLAGGGRLGANQEMLSATV
jgi:hypothetical protein